MSDPGNVVRGLKGAISNPNNNSEEAKERAQQRMDDMVSSGEVDTQEAHNKQVERSHNVCKNASIKRNNGEVLEDM